MDTALIGIVWIALFVVGPPALLIWLVRRRRRREREAAAQAQLPPAESAIALDAKAPAQGAAMVAAPPESATEQRGNGYMFPYGVPLVVYPLLGVGIASVRAGWMAGALAIVAGLIALSFIRLAFDKEDFERACNNDPGLNLPTWRINWLLFFALPPALLALFGLARWLRP